MALDTPQIPIEDQSTTPPVEEQETNELFIFQTVKKRLEGLIKKHKECVKDKVDMNRELRFIDIDLNSAAFKDNIKKNDLMILVRSINTNIKREQPTYVAYLKQPERIATFTTVGDSADNNTEIESEFHRGLTYSGWDIPYIKCIDSGQNNGWAFVEVVFDETKPFNIALEFVAPDKLIFHDKAQDLQAQEIIIREYEIVPKDLKKSVAKYGFDPVQVDELTKDLTDDKKDEPICIFKKYCKYEDIVYVSWFSMKCSDWLKAPAPIYVGRLTQQLVDVPVEIPAIDPVTGLPTTIPSTQQVPQIVDGQETMYPLFLCLYDITELPFIVDAKGRAFHDKYKQEARTANISAFTSACLRAVDVVMSPTNPVESSSKLEGFEYKHGAITKVPVNFSSTPFPEGEMLSLAQYLDAYDAEEAGRPSYAVQKKSPGARVTAEQIKSARQDQSQLNALQVSSFSSFMRNVLTYIWGIVQSRALAGRITFLQDPNTGENDYERIAKDYDIRAAGDTDVVKKAELLQLYMEFWPIVAPTAAAPMYLAKMLRLAFGKEGEEFIGVLASGDPRVVLMGILDLLKTTLDPEEIPQDPQVRLQLQNLIQQAESIVAPVRAASLANQAGSRNGEGGVGNKPPQQEQPVEAAQ